MPTVGDALGLGRQMGQEAVDIALGKLPGVPVLVELDVQANPIHAGFFGALAVMANAEDEWRDSHSCGRNDLPLTATVADLAHS